MSSPFRSVDPASLPKHFDSAGAEARWDEVWERSGLHHYDPNRPREETFVVDTPPPTVSGSLHVGHVFSYTHTDVIVRCRRMQGFNIFYPIGWDDNGVPTERRVQNLFHVRCDPALPRDPDLALEEANAKIRKGRHRVISRPDFIDLCDRVTAEDEKVFKGLWRRVGLSVDWRSEYATIDARCRHLAQLSFRDLFEKDLVYTSDAPFMWDPDFQMAVAQAEVEDREKEGAYHDIEFGVEGSDRSFVISTTRPELLAACVGVTAHPEDDRYKDLFGKRAVTPLFHAPVPIFPSDKADPEKGTGILMVCTFGDATDVEWWRDEGLELRQILGRNGRLEPASFGGEGYESRKPEDANRFYSEIAGKNVKQARRRIVELLSDPEGSATGGGAPLQREPRAIKHAVKFYEKGESPLEFLPTRQWFVRLLDKKERLLEKGREIQWHPGHMMKRFEDWTTNLAFDWCISRQRYFGVPIPVWYPVAADGRPDQDHPIVAEPDQLPVDPMTDVPHGFEEAQRGQPGGFVGEADIFDTWFTSSLTPQVSSHWLLDADRHARLFPADIRPQSHEIIRTWDDPCDVGACCFGDECADGIRFECVDAGGEFLDGTCKADPCAPFLPCPDGSLFAQTPDMPDGFTAFTSENSAGLQRFENFTRVAGAIEEIVWWGLDLRHLGGGQFEECVETDPTFEIAIHADAGGVPGDVLCFEKAFATRTPLGISYAGAELNEYRAPITPPCAVVNGWVSIVGFGDPGCWFLWMSSPGAGTSYCLGCRNEVEGSNLSLCLQGETGGVFGACCIDDTGACQEGVEIDDCVAAGRRFVPNGTCDDLDPPCGMIVGACCFDDATCSRENADDCNASGGNWLGAFTECVQCPCTAVCPEGARPEGEPRCGDGYVDEYNGGCRANPARFLPIDLGETICGESGFFDEGNWDEDWYEVIVTKPVLLEWTIVAEFPVRGRIYDGRDGCPGELQNNNAAFECDLLTMTAPAQPGRYWLVVGPAAFTDSAACGAGYTATLGPDPCPADLNGDGTVGFEDVLQLLAAWGPCGDCPEDLDRDGAVDFTDLVTLLAAWGSCTGP